MGGGHLVAFCRAEFGYCCQQYGNHCSLFYAVSSPLPRHFFLRVCASLLSVDRVAFQVGSCTSIQPLLKLKSLSSLVVSGPLGSSSSSSDEQQPPVCCPELVRLKDLTSLR